MKSDRDKVKYILYNKITLIKYDSMYLHPSEVEKRNENIPRWGSDNIAWISEDEYETLIKEG